MHDTQETVQFFIYFFLFGVPSVIAAFDPHLKMSFGLRLAAIGGFLLAVFIIIRVYVFGVPEYKVFVF